MTIEILKSEAPEPRELERPLAWENDKIMISVLLDEYHVQKMREQQIKDVLGLAHETGAKVEMRILTPKGRKTIAFPFLKFEDIYLQPEKAIPIFKKAAKDYLKEQGYDVEIQEGEREERLKMLAKAVKRERE